MISYLRRWKRQRQTRSELEQLSDRELWDLGIVRANILEIVRSVE